jgi:hypothetical protein
MLHLHGGFGHHVAPFVATPSHLAETVRERLRSFLKHVIPPVVPVRGPVVLKVLWSRRLNADSSNREAARNDMESVSETANLRRSRRS